MGALTDASIDAADAAINPDMARVENELLRLCRTYVPATIARRNGANGWNLQSPQGFDVAPGDKNSVLIRSVTLEITERAPVLAVRSFKVISDVRFRVIAGDYPLDRNIHQNSRRLTGVIASVLAGADASNNSVQLGWKDPDGYILWAQLMPAAVSITPFGDSQSYGHMLNLEMLQYPGANGRTTS